jgi:diacylglycerol kinase family enzyme
VNYQAVINRDSGSGLFRDVEQQNRLKQVFSDRGHHLDLEVIAPSDLQETLKRKIESHPPALIIGGGDGTITTAAQLLKGTEIALGVLPLGTFNLESRDLKIPLDPFAAAEELINAEQVEIDILQVNDKCCLCATIIGFYPALAKSREDFHGKSWWKKSFRIVRELATVAVRAPALLLEISGNGETIHRRTRLAAFSPGQYVENVGIIPVRENLSSGELSAYISGHLSRGQMLGAALGYLSGNIFESEKITRIESREITISVRHRSSILIMIDGEISRMEMPCRLKILPRALKVLRPINPAR